MELMRAGKDERVRGTAAQALLDRGWGKAKVEVLTKQTSNAESYIEALVRVAGRVSKNSV